ncbi:MAG TPA: ABC transporter permease [Planctomycetota bacterium]
MRHLGRELGLALALALLAGAIALVAPGFFAPGNLRSLALDSLPLLLAATGMTLVLLAGEIDVSVGAQLAAAGVLAGILAKLGLPIGLVVPCVLAAGVGFGALQGLLVARGVPAVVVTLASLAILRGGLRWGTGGRWIDGLPADFQWFGLGQTGGQVVGALGTLALVGAAALVLRRLHAGRALLAVGCDPAAARLAGVRVERVRVGALAAMGFFAAAAALVSATRYPAIEIEAGAGLELSAIACAVLGGTSIRGGRGTVLGTLLGVALFGALGTALVFLGVGAAWERAVQGLVILAALAPELLARRWTGGRLRERGT